MNAEFKNFIQKVKNFEPTGAQKTRLDNIIIGMDKLIDCCKTIVFLCTHNSRRSQLCEVWGNYFAYVYNRNINILSAGAVKTKVYKEVYKSLERVGVKVDKNSSVNIENITIAPFSKTLTEVKEKEFMSIMTCSDSEKTCPADPRSIINLQLFYEDPRRYDNTPDEAEEYDKTSFMIATEINYILKKIN